MTRPGVSITSIAVRPRRGAPTDTGSAFFVGPTGTGTAGVPVTVNSFAAYTAAFGGRTGTAANISDAAETFFAEGGARLTVVRTSDAAGAVVTVADALAALPESLGPGQVAAPGDSTTAAWGALLTHCANVRGLRTALLDGAQDASFADISAAGTTVQNLANSNYGGLFVAWPRIGAAAGGSTPRTIPPSGLVAGLIARGDRTLSPAQPPAGNKGYSRVALDVTGPVFTDAQRTALTLLGVNTIRVGSNGVQLYGFRATTPLPEWSQLTAHRTRMIIVTRALALSEQFLFRPLDGKGQLRAEFAGVLGGELNRLYEQGALFGATPEQAYSVDTRPPAGTATDVLYALLLARPSKYAEQVAIELVFTDDIAA